jgi:hypothetical protein
MLCPLRIEGILRVGDLIRVFGDYPDEDAALLTALPRSPSGAVDMSEPWPALFIPRGVPSEAFEHVVPADFGERAAREGRLIPADAWSVWPLDEAP